MEITSESVNASSAHNKCATTANSDCGHDYDY